VIAAVDRYTGFRGSALVLLVAAGVAAAVVTVVFAVRWIASFPKQPDPGPETSDLGPEPPAIVNLLVNRFAVGRAAVPATLVDLAARRVLGLEQVGPDRIVVRVRTRPDADQPLTPYEQQVLDTVRADATGGSAPIEAIALGSTDAAAAWWKRFSKAVVADARARGLARSRWERSDWLLLGGLIGIPFFLLAAAFSGAHVGSGGENPMDGADWFFVGFFASGVAMAGLASLRALRDTPDGRAAAARWLGVGAHQRSNPSFADAPPASVAIWGRSLAYGVALGTARATTAALPIAAEDPFRAWSRYGGTWRQIRIEYPTRFGYGERPSTVLLGGLGRLVLWGVVAFAVLPIVVDALWGFVSEQAPDVGSGVELAIGAAFILVFGAIGTYLVVRLVDAGIRTFRGAADLGSPVTEEGVVVAVGGEEQAGYVAVDDGQAAEIRAWRRTSEIPPVRRGARVRVTLSRHLRYVTGIEVVDPAT
jgi:hypothetical protein